jgi:hypothetical protein
MGRVDQWWNKHFPPFSWERLAFGVVMIPIISLLWRLMANEVFTWGRYIAITLMTQFFFAVMYVIARSRRDEIAEMQADGTAPIEWGLPRKIPSSGNETPASPSVPSELEREALLGLSQQNKKPRVSPHLDFMLSFVIGFFTFTALLFIFVPETPTLMGVLMTGATSLVFTVALTYRNSIPIMIGLCVLLGYPLAQIARALYSVMSFFSDPGPLAIWWPLTSFAIFIFLAPGWFAMRRRRQVFQRLRIPNWVTTSLVSVFLLVTTAMATVEVGTTPASAAPGSERAPADQPAPGAFGVSTSDEALLRLFFAWKNGDRATAAQVAVPGVVRNLFDIPVESSARPLGCGIDASGNERCTIRRSGDLVLLIPESTGQGTFFFSSAELGPLDFPITYQRPGDPTTAATP